MINAKEILEQYPKIKINGKSWKFHEINGDLLFIDMNGRIERIKEGVIVKYKKFKGFYLKVKDYELIDEGLNVEDVKIWVLLIVLVVVRL